VDLSLRIRVDEYADDVLDARYAAMTPEQREATNARHNALVDAFSAADQQP
jgi:hypothetical protein